MNKILKKDWINVGILLCVFLGAIAYIGSLRQETFSEAPTPAANPKGGQINPLMGKPHNTYSQGAFSISYPQSWSRGETAANGDGVRFFTSNPDLDIRVFLRRVDEGDPYLSGPTFLLDSGKVAKLVRQKSGDQTELQVILEIPGYEYIFYAHGPTVDIEETEDLLQVARTLTLSNE